MNLTEQVQGLLDSYPVNAAARRESTPKPDGGVRVLTKPNRSLSAWLKQTNAVFNECFNDWPEYIHGGRKKHSYVGYARPHVGKPCVITIDIRKCFDSIAKQQVATALEKHLGLTSSNALRLAHKLCFRNNLAQGFATSNFICNLVLLDALKAINEFLVPRGIDFTNYVDDLALSGAITDHDIVINEVAGILSKAGLAVKKAKIHVMPATRQQIICGLVVNKRLTVSKAKKADLIAAARDGSMTKASANGWVANLKNVDVPFSEKLRASIKET